MLHDGKFYIKLGLPSGNAFPTVPAPEEADIYYREDENRPYIYDSVAWHGLAQLDVAETITDDWTWGTDKKILFRDAAIYIHSAADGFLDLVADTAIRLNADVGIGTASPGAELEVAKAADNCEVIISEYSAVDQRPILTFRRSDSDVLGTISQTDDGDYLGSIYFRGVDTGSNWDWGAAIEAFQKGAAGTRVPTQLHLFTFSSTGPNSNQLVLDEAGNVGIGTSTPSGTLEVTTSAGAQIDIDATSGTAQLRLLENGNFEYAIQYDITNTRFELYSFTAGADVIRIPDTQTDVLGNTDFLDDQFDWVCQECEWHSGTRQENCPRCGGKVEWQDDAMLMNALTKSPGTLGEMPRHLLARFEQMGILDTFGTLNQPPKEREIFMNWNQAHWFTWSAVAQLWRRVQKLEAQIPV